MDPGQGIIDSLQHLFDPILDPIFGIFLHIGPTFTILILSIVITLISVLIHKRFTDQQAFKRIKEESVEIRKQLKETSKTDPDKAIELNKKLMESSMVQMKGMWKPMIISMLPLLILFGWLIFNVGNLPIQPNQEFTTSVIFKEPGNGTITIELPEGIELLDSAAKNIEPTKIGFWAFKTDRGVAQWKLKGESGLYELKYTYKGITYNKDVLITEEYKYVRPQITIKDSDILNIKIDNKTLKILGLHWLLAYIIITFVLNSLFRKLFKVH